MRLHTFLVVCIIGCSRSTRDCRNEDAWVNALRAERLRYPAMAPQDAFKFVQQASLGSEHWVREGEAKEWLDREWETLGAGPTESLVDTLLPTRRFARINLRPYRAAGGDRRRLLAAFVSAGASAAHDTSEFQCGLAAIIRGAAPRGPWGRDSLAIALDRWRAQHYAALDHSPAYAAAYQPAYRVVLLSSVPGVLVLRRAAPAMARTGIVP